MKRLWTGWIGLLLLHTPAFAENGSSGVGSVPIDDAIRTEVANPASLANRNGYLLDLKSGEKLIKIDHVSKGDLKSYSGNLVPSSLGQVHGYEFLPDKDQIKNKNNFWVICGDGENCLKLVPVSDSNPKVMNIVGGLKRVEKGDSSGRSSR